VPTLLVDGRPFSAAWASSGSATYLRGLLPSLVDEGFDVKALVLDEGPTPPSVERVPVRRLAPERGRYYEQLLRLPGDIQRTGADLFHSPALDPPLRSPVPWAQTLLDVIPLAFDDARFRAEALRWRARARRIRRADAVIAISAYTANEGVRRLALDPARVHVAHLAVDSDFTPPGGPRADDPPYLLYVSSLGPHKGYREAFAVISLLAELGYPHHLKMTGGMWKSETQRVQAALDGTGQWRDRIELVGRVSREELIRLYQGAAVVIVTSRYEGFGLPALEAMATATPVVTFDNSSLPEVVGDGGTVVPDGDTAAFAHAVRPLLDDEALWDEASAAALTRAGDFSWEASARVHAEVFRTCLARH
jgi:O-antigen biosynthesis alpha-1,3-rhamnosyltransferase